MSKVSTYLNFPKNTEEAFNFYKSVFGGEFSGFMRFSEMPANGKHSTFGRRNQEPDYACILANIRRT